MAKYKTTDIKTEIFDGVLAEVKYLDVYTKESFQKTLCNLAEDSYAIVRHNRHSAYLMHAFDSKDVVVLNCKPEIRLAWIRMIFPEYFQVLNIDKYKETMANIENVAK